ncbi:hypothetical protein DH2020_012933 [Rehmannia glutinosa]|uniref:NB-ARC domain-containing protein n=1 Tax=Rehmannia glutinosa TaxID=99300 RepID=A0ABR0X1J3_REHGL
MAYAAVVSLRQTIHRLLNISNVSILPCSLEILNFAYKEVRSILRLFKELDERSGLVDKNRLDDEPQMRRLRNYDIFRDKRRSRRRGFRGYGQRMKSLAGKVRDAAFKLEDALETHFVNLIHERRHPSTLISVDLEELIKQDINSFTKTLKELEGYMKELCNPILPHEEEDDDDDDDVVVSSRIDFGGKKSKMVGFSDEFRQIKDLLHGDDDSVNFVSLVGMAGLGKTTLVEELFEDSSILEWFDHRVWVTVGPKYQFKDIVQSILSQVNPNIGEILVEGDELDNKFRESLKGRRCLIVVDDVWDVEITRHMKHLIMLANVGSRDKLGSLILLTTRLEKVDVHKSMESISTVRSLLCTGPHHQYPVPVCFGLRLLRVIHALTIRFYEFPLIPLMELVKLVLLRYLALTYDGKLPPSISKLWNLQFFIVRRHLSIINLYEDELYLPMEIWDMKELKHLQFMGGNLPDPCDGALLPNLLTLTDVSARSCTEGVLKGLPKLGKLGIRIELAPDITEPLCCFDHISHLDKLESLKCVVVNPELKSEVIAPLSSSPHFPEKLRKLSLSGLGYQWEDMKVIASLPNLRVLKLRCYAFQGPKWDTHEMGFPLLEFLLIEDTDLVNWTVGRGSFSKLQCLNLKQCYTLQEIPRKFRGSLTSIEIFDCNPLIVTCAKEMQKNRSNLQVNVHSSWDDGKLKA